MTSHQFIIVSVCTFQPPIAALPKRIPSQHKGDPNKRPLSEINCKLLTLATSPPLALRIADCLVNISLLLQLTQTTVTRFTRFRFEANCLQCSFCHKLASVTRPAVSVQLARWPAHPTVCSLSHTNQCGSCWQSSVLRGYGNGRNVAFRFANKSSITTEFISQDKCSKSYTAWNSLSTIITSMSIIVKYYKGFSVLFTGFWKHFLSYYELRAIFSCSRHTFMVLHCSGCEL